MYLKLMSYSNLLPDFVTGWMWWVNVIRCCHCMLSLKPVSFVEPPRVAEKLRQSSWSMSSFLSLTWGRLCLYCYCWRGRNFSPQPEKKYNNLANMYTKWMTVKAETAYSQLSFCQARHYLLICAFNSLAVGRLEIVTLQHCFPSLRTSLNCSFSFTLVMPLQPSINFLSLPFLSQLHLSLSRSSLGITSFSLDNSCKISTPKLNMSAAGVYWVGCSSTLPPSFPFDFLDAA